MIGTFSLAMMIAALVTTQEPAGPGKGASVLPFVGEEVAIVIHADLAKVGPQAIVKRLGGKVGETDDLEEPTRLASAWVDALKAAGAKELYLLIDLTDMPGLPLVVVPITAGADEPSVRAVLAIGAGGPVRWAAVETFRGAVVAGGTGAIARLKSAVPAERGFITEALRASGDAAITMVLVPSRTQRRALEESITTLPPQLGGGDIRRVTQGMEWATLATSFEPQPALRGLIEAKTANATSGLLKIIDSGLRSLKQVGGDNPALKPLIDALSGVKPVASGKRITLDADLHTTADLLAMPLRQARESARRSQCVNNLKFIGLAMHNFHATYNAFPGAYTKSADGKPLLSWRVQILPFVEQNSLYQQFHLDEPWDSPHNRKLIARMPAVFACPSGKKALAAEGKTTYLTPRGPKTIFSGGERLEVQDITDGTSNTIMVVDASDDAAVIWTKPDDWDVPAVVDPHALAGHHSSGFNVGFADGSVRFIRATVMPEVLKALLTATGGEVVSFDSF